MALSPKKRFYILERDGFACRYCGRTPPEAHLEVDHVIPKLSGGSDEFDNLVTACFECNRGKKDARDYTHLYEIVNDIFSNGLAYGVALQMGDMVANAGRPSPPVGVYEATTLLLDFFRERCDPKELEREDRRHAALLEA